MVAKSDSKADSRQKSITQFFGKPKGALPSLPSRTEPQPIDVDARTSSPQPAQRARQTPQLPAVATAPGSLAPNHQGPPLAVLKPNARPGPANGNSQNGAATGSVASKMAPTTRASNATQTTTTAPKAPPPASSATSPKRQAPAPAPETVNQSQQGSPSKFRQTVLNFGPVKDGGAHDEECSKPPFDPSAAPKPRSRILPDLDPRILTLSHRLPELSPLPSPDLPISQWRRLTLSEALQLSSVCEWLDAWGGELEGLFEPEAEEDDVATKRTTRSKDAAKEEKQEDVEFKWGTFVPADAQFAALERLLYSPAGVRLPTLSALYSRLLTQATAEDETTTTEPTALSFPGLLELALAKSHPDISRLWRDTPFHLITPPAHTLTLSALCEAVLGSERGRAVVNGAAEALADFGKHKWARARQRKQLEGEMNEAQEKMAEMRRRMDVLEGKAVDDPIQVDGQGPTSSSNPEVGTTSAPAKHPDLDEPVAAPPTGSISAPVSRPLRATTGKKRELAELTAQYSELVRSDERRRREIRKLEREAADEAGEKERLERRMRGARWVRKAGCDRFGRTWWWWCVVPGTEVEGWKDKKGKKRDSGDVAGLSSKGATDQPPVYGVIVEDPAAPQDEGDGIGASSGTAGLKRAADRPAAAVDGGSPTLKKAKAGESRGVPTLTVSPEVLAPTDGLPPSPVDLTAEPPMAPKVRSRLLTPATLSHLGRVLAALNDRGQRERVLKAGIEEELTRVGVDVRGKTRELVDGERKTAAEKAWKRFADWLAERGTELKATGVKDDDVLAKSSSVTTGPTDATDAGWTSMVAAEVRRLTESACAGLGLLPQVAEKCCEEPDAQTWVLSFRAAMETRVPPRNSIRKAIQTMADMEWVCGRTWSWGRCVFFLEETIAHTLEIERHSHRRPAGQVEHVECGDGTADSKVHHSGADLVDPVADVMEGRRLRSAVAPPEEEDDELIFSNRGYAKRKAAVKAASTTKDQYLVTTRSGRDLGASSGASGSSGRSQADKVVKVRETGLASARRKGVVKKPVRTKDFEKKARRKGRRSGCKHEEGSSKEDMAVDSEAEGADEDDEKDASEFERGSAEGSAETEGSESADESKDESDQDEHEEPPPRVRRRLRGRGGSDDSEGQVQTFAVKKRTPRKVRGEKKSYAESGSEAELEEEAPPPRKLRRRKMDEGED